MHIKVTKGLTIPIAGKPSTKLQPPPTPSLVACDLTPYPPGAIKLLVQEGFDVERGAPLAQEKKGKYVIASPAGGKIIGIRRGEKRQLLEVRIEVAKEEPIREWPKSNGASPQELYRSFIERGGLVHIQQRPWGTIPTRWPRDIFISLHQSAPFEPKWEPYIERHQDWFERGLWALSQWVSGSIHLVSSLATPTPKMEKVRCHTIEGPHPSGLSSIHIHHIAPIQHVRDTVWVVSPTGVVTIGGLLQGYYPVERVIALAGEGVLEEERGLFISRMGSSIRSLVDGRLHPHPAQCISGNPLTGKDRDLDGFLGFDHTTLSILPLAQQRECFHFMGLGNNKFSSFRAYLSGWRHKSPYPFTTTQHGEERAFIDPQIYQKVMPMRVAVTPLIKALLAEDYELAEKLGFLEVVGEDFALPTFICPSKIHLMEIVNKALAVQVMDGD